MARYYNQEIGTFISLDPYNGDIDDLTSQNGYTYTNNNPIISTDPDGKYWKNVWWNSEWFISSTIYAVFFITAGLVGNALKVFLKKLANRQLSESRRTIFFLNSRKICWQKEYLIRLQVKLLVF